MDITGGCGVCGWLEERGAVQEESGEKRMGGGDSWSSWNRGAWWSVFSTG